MRSTAFSSLLDVIVEPEPMLGDALTVGLLVVGVLLITGIVLIKIFGKKK